MKVSVIVPIFNVEQYIRECIVSIINQTLKEIEIILVNDGSTDRSIDIIKDLVTSNSNIILINKENGGLSSARNEGIKYARGQYIAFIDSDDYLHPNFLETLYLKGIDLDLDIVCGGYTKVYTKDVIQYKRNEKLFQLGVITGKDLLKYQLLNNDYCMEVVDDLYKREFLEKYNLRFKDGILHEDEEFTPKALLKANKVCLIETYKYMYRFREESIMTKKVGIKNINSIRLIIEEYVEEFYKINDENTREVLRYLIKYLIQIYEDKIIQSKNKENWSLLNVTKDKKIQNIIFNNNILTIKQRLKYYIINLDTELYLSVKVFFEKYKNKLIKKTSN